jgi:Tfp pilus assembly protein PilP
MMNRVSFAALGLVLAAALGSSQGAQSDTTRRVEQGRDTTAVQMMVGGLDLSMQREVFSYAMRGRRDPMVSLMNTDDVRPLISEVKIISIVYDEDGNNHQAVLLNTVDKKTRYRVKVGQMLGRLRVTQINRQDIVFTLNEFGFSRQERLSIKPDTTAARRTP